MRRLCDTNILRNHPQNQYFSNKPQVSDIKVTAALLQHAEESCPDSVDDEVDERVVSVLLETTGEPDNESHPAITRKVGPRIHLHPLRLGKLSLT